MDARWIPISERLPKKNGRYLTIHLLMTTPPQPWIEVLWFAKNLYKEDKYDFADQKGNAGFYNYDSEYGHYVVDGISHWMPLPDPPEVAKK